MPTRAQIEQAIFTHFDAWNARDRARWTANWADDVILEDPVGGPTKRGREAVDASWDNSFKEGHTWTIDYVLMQICKNEAALHVVSTGTVDNDPVRLETIEIYTVNDAGKICYCKTYFNPPPGQKLDPYFMEAHG